MSYYILQKYEHNKPIIIEDKWSTNLEAIINPSLIYYLNKILSQFNDPIFLSNFIKLNKIMNTYKYIYSKVPNYNTPISKLAISSTAYIYIELIQICNLFETVNDVSINCININNFDFMDSVHFFKENNENIYYNFNDLNTNLSTNNYADIINIYLSDSFTNFNTYIHSVMNSICYIFKNQKLGGCSIIKIDHLFYKPIIDLLFILNNSYDKIYIIKPHTSSIVKNDMYIVCKKFKLIHSETYIEKLQYISNKLISNTTQIISSLINNEIPYYFLNKIEEANVIIYHQKIQYIDQINNIIMNKQKMDNIKKNNIQKCIQWCEKYNIPHHKITDKVNIFLQPAIEISEETEVLESIDINNLIHPTSLNDVDQYKLLKIFNID